MFYMSKGIEFPVGIFFLRIFAVVNNILAYN